MDPLKRLWQTVAMGLRKMFALGGGSYLCDRCRWDYGDACSRPERPNARTCPDFKAK